MDKIIKKIAALQALTESPNEHEATRAAEKVAELLQEYNLSLSDITTSDDHIQETYVIKKNFIQSWIINKAIAELYFCTHYNYQAAPGLKFSCTVGLPHNVRAAFSMTEYLIKTINLLANQHSNAYPRKARKKYKRSFRLAATLRLEQRIHEKIEEAKAPTQEKSGLPALYDNHKELNIQFLASKGISLKMGSAPRHHFGDQQGAIDGQQAADNISLNTQLGEDNDSKQRLS